MGAITTPVQILTVSVLGWESGEGKGRGSYLKGA